MAARTGQLAEDCGINSPRRPGEGPQNSPADKPQNQLQCHKGPAHHAYLAFDKLLDIGV
jgi:hypothetical protein